MDKIFLHRFNNEISTIAEYIKHIQLINEIEKQHRGSSDAILTEFTTHLYSFRNEKKLFEYKSIVVSLYGILEKYINIWLQEHISNLPLIFLKPELLPEKISSKHFDLSIKLISLIRENRYAKLEDLDAMDILAKLNACTQKVSPYELNNEAFSPSSGNLKHSTIVDALGTIDIKLTAKLKVHTRFSSYLKTIFGTAIEGKGNELFKKIDDLVIRRNEIAHGAEITSTLSLNEFYDYMMFLTNYGTAIFEIINEKELEYETLFSYSLIDQVKGVFAQGSVLCFEAFNLKVKVGDEIIVKDHTGSYFKKKIITIKKEKTFYKTMNIAENEKLNIGVNLGSGITKKQSFYIKKTL